MPLGFERDRRRRGGWHPKGAWFFKLFSGLVNFYGLATDGNNIILQNGEKVGSHYGL